MPTIWRSISSASGIRELRNSFSDSVCCTGLRLARFYAGVNFGRSEAVVSDRLVAIILTITEVTPIF